MIVRTFSKSFLPLPVYPITFCSHHYQEEVNRPSALRNMAQILFVCAGEGDMMLDGEHYSLRAGNAFFMDRDVSHSYRGEGLITAWVGFGGVGLQDIRRYIGQRAFFFVENADVGAAVACIAEMENEYNAARREGVLSAHVYRLLMSFIDGQERESEDCMERVIRFMEAQYASRITVDELAAICHLSRSSFCKRFKETFGCTSFERLTEIRLLNAEMMLKLYPDDKINTIAKRCGFDDVGYFCKAFKGHFGMTPSSYRLHRAAPRGGQEGVKKIEKGLDKRAEI